VHQDRPERKWKGVSTLDPPTATDYGEGFYAGHVRHRSRYERIAATLHHILKPLSVADVGCGNAYILEFLLRTYGVDVMGVDGSPGALPFVHPSLASRILISDLRRPLVLPKSYELVICTEVGEHLEATAADVLVESVARHARYWIYFTAAQPGQPGVGHVNCQPKRYWQEKFAPHGFVRDHGIEARVKAGIWPVRTSLPWLYDNLMIFCNPEGQRRYAPGVGPASQFFLRASVGLADLLWSVARGTWRTLPARLRKMLHGGTRGSR
jgi:SAM-dependent methyltransferase